MFSYDDNYTEDDDDVDFGVGVVRLRVGEVGYFDFGVGVVRIKGLGSLLL